MLNFLTEIIGDYCIKNNRFTIESVDNFDNKKLSIVLDFKNFKMISIEFLPNGILDLMVADIESEEILSFEVSQVYTEETLKEKIIHFLDNI